MKTLKHDFPIFNQLINGKPLIYVDNAATTHKPYHVIKAMSDFYSSSYATINRSIYHLSELATEAVNNIRIKTAQFIEAQPHEIIFTKNTTEGINFIAATWAAQNLKSGDEIVLSELEHHSNLLPWLEVAVKQKITIRFIPVNQQGELDEESLQNIFNQRTKLVAITHISNALGTHIDIKKIINKAHAVGARILIDAAQSIAYQHISLLDLKADFLAFSAHKMLGPTGLGVLYISESVQSEVPPYQFGGGMVYEADYNYATWLKGPSRYEAGTIAIAEIIGFGAALDYYHENINFIHFEKHMALLCKRLIEGLQQYQQIRILGPVHQLITQGHLVSFMVQGYHAHDVGAYFDSQGIAVRTGHYCAQPLAKKLNIHGSIRISFHCYNTLEEVNIILAGIKKLLEK